MKVAASLDGKTALDNGVSQWITSEPARADGHAWRARACAVLTGIGTVVDDNPRLDVRLWTPHASRIWPWWTAGSKHRTTPACSNRSGVFSSMRPSTTGPSAARAAKRGAPP
jgi:riboflavin biosynthesis pyrimidine reductase